MHQLEVGDDCAHQDGGPQVPPQNQYKHGDSRGEHLHCFVSVADRVLRGCHEPYHVFPSNHRLIVSVAEGTFGHHQYRGKHEHTDEEGKEHGLELVLLEVYLEWEMSVEVLFLEERVESVTPDLTPFREGESYDAEHHDPDHTEYNGTVVERVGDGDSGFLVPKRESEMLAEGVGVHAAEEHFDAKLYSKWIVPELFVGNYLSDQSFVMKSVMKFDEAKHRGHQRQPHAQIEQELLFEALLRKLVREFPFLQ